MFALAMLLQIDGGSGFVWTNIISLLHSGTSLHNISDGPMWMMITALLHGGVLGESIPTGWPRDVSFFGAGSGNIAALVPWVVMFVIANKRVNNLH